MWFSPDYSAIPAQSSQVANQYGFSFFVRVFWVMVAYDRCDIYSVVSGDDIGDSYLFKFQYSLFQVPFL